MERNLILFQKVLHTIPKNCMHFFVAFKHLVQKPKVFFLIPVSQAKQQTENNHNSSEHVFSKALLNISTENKLSVQAISGHPITAFTTVHMWETDSWNENATKSQKVRTKSPQKSLSELEKDLFHAVANNDIPKITKLLNGSNLFVENNYGASLLQ